MSSEEDVEKMQKILAASVILIALSLGIGGFDFFKTWYQLDIASFNLIITPFMIILWYYLIN